MSSSSAPQPEPRPQGLRPLLARHAAALVMGNMIGTGVFTTTGLVLHQLGSPALVLGVWVVAGLLALGGAAVYAELGAMMPRAGGEYVYLSRAFHPAVGFLSGWVALPVGFAAPTAVSALAFGRYLAAVFPSLPVRAAALALVVAATLLHARDVRRGGGVQAVFTALVVGVAVAFVAGAVLGGGGQLDWGRLRGADLAAGAAAGGAATAGAGGAGALAVSLIYVSYAYCGWNAAAYVAGEVRDPDRALPRALVGGTALVTALYLALNAVFLAAAPAAALDDRVEVADVAARALFGARGGAALSALVALALAGSVGALTMTGPRVVQAMAEDGVLPGKWLGALGRTNARGAPAAAVLLQGGLAALLVLTDQYEALLVYVGFTLTLSSAAAVAGAFVLRRREPHAPRPHRALGWPWSGIGYLALTSFMAAFSIKERPLESLVGLATLAAGGAVWALTRRRGRRQPQ